MNMYCEMFAYKTHGVSKTVEDEVSGWFNIIAWFVNEACVLTVYVSVVTDRSCHL